MPQVKYRVVNPGLAPRRTRLEMPGWAGQPEPRADGSQEFAWHCAPFTEGAQYGIEVFYPYDNELRVSRKSGKLIFDGDLGPRPDNSGDLMWPPFRCFGQDYYTYQLLLDLKVGKDWAVRTEPHPRFYTDPTDTVPIAVPALLRTEWWPMISFVVFKSPVETHACLSARRADAADSDTAGDCRLHFGGDGRRGSGGTGAARASHPRQPTYSC
jgi:hypothetical protein